MVILGEDYKVTELGFCNICNALSAYPISFWNCLARRTDYFHPSICFNGYNHWFTFLCIVVYNYSSNAWTIRLWKRKQYLPFCTGYHRTIKIKLQIYSFTIFYCPNTPNGYRIYISNIGRPWNNINRWSQIIISQGIELAGAGSAWITKHGMPAGQPPGSR